MESTEAATEMHVAADGGIVAPHATAAAVAIAAHELSCREVVQAHLAHSEVIYGARNAVVSLGRTRLEIQGGLRLSAVDLYAASQTRTRLFMPFRALFERLDALALPRAQVFSFAPELDRPESVVSAKVDSYGRWMEVVVPDTRSGCPVACLPVVSVNSAGCLPASS